MAQLFWYTLQIGCIAAAIVIYVETGPHEEQMGAAAVIGWGAGLFLTFFLVKLIDLTKWIRRSAHRGWLALSGRTFQRSVDVIERPRQHALPFPPDRRR